MQATGRDAHNSVQRSLSSVYGWTLLAALPPALLIFIIARYGIDVPYVDEWDFVPFLDKSYQGKLTLADLWTVHNEHRIFFPRILMLGLARLTNWDIRWQMGLSFLLACGIFAVATWQIRKTWKALGQTDLKWAVVACSVVVFSISQYENWMWGWQMQMFLEMLALWGAVVLLGQPQFSWKRFAGADLLGIVASYSFASGAFVWPLGTMLLLAVRAERTERLVATSAWLSLGIITLCWYFYEYHRPEDLPAMQSFSHKPANAVLYIVKYVGSLCAQYEEGGVVPNAVWGVTFGVLGPAALAWAGWTIISRRIADWRQLLPYFAMAAYALATGAVTMLARVGLGSNQGMTSRYCTMSAPFWLVLLILLLVIATSGSSSLPAPGAGCSDPRRIARWLFWGVLVAVGLSSAFACGRAQEMSLSRAAGRHALLELAKHGGVDNNGGLYTITEHPGIITERYPVLVKHHLSLFRDERAVPIRTEVVQHP